MIKILPFEATKQLTETAKAHRFLTGLAIFYVFSVLWGAYRFYSPIPQLDMWDGYINFYLHILAGDSGVWWRQHNEHLPVLARILFYFDLAWFGGQSRLLIPINVVLVFFSWYMLLLYARLFLQDRAETVSFYYLLVLLTVMALSWKQDENIIWAFQGQFWLAYLIPLSAFYWLARSETDRHKQGIYFSLACLLGVLSAGTMANGIFALPLMFVMSLALRKKAFYSAILALAAVLVAGLYLYNYQTPVGHNSIIDNVVQKPWQTVLFFVEYVGVPPKNIYASFLFGIFHLYLIAVVLLNIKQHRDNPFYLSVVAFLLYFLATAVITSAGRVNLGLNAALVGRYTTPALISFSLALILYLYNRPDHFKYLGKRTVIILAVLMLGTQARTVIKNVDKIHDIRDRETLWMELGSYVDEALKTGSDEFNYTKFQKIADHARLKKISVFGIEPFVGKRQKLGQKINDSACQKIEYTDSPVKHIYMLSIDKAVPIDEAVYISNQQKQIIGYGLPSRQYKKSVSVILGPGVEQGAGSLILYRCR